MYKTIKVVCCEKPEINVNTCCNCGSIVNTKYVNEFIDFHLKKHAFHEKSIYNRKYHVNNNLNKLIEKYNIYISVQQYKKVQKYLINK